MTVIMVTPVTVIKVASDSDQGGNSNRDHDADSDSDENSDSDHGDDNDIGPHPFLAQDCPGESSQRHLVFAQEV